MAIGAGDVVRVSAEFLALTTDMQVNTWDLRVNTAGTGGNDGFQAAVEEYLSNLYSHVTTIISENVVANGVSYYSRLSLDVLLPTTWLGAPAFTASGDVLPLQDALVVFFRSSRRGSRCRKFLPSSTEAFNVGAVPAATAIAAATALVDEGLTPFTSTAGWVLELVLWSDVTNAAITLLNGEVSPQWGTQRRRRVGRGV